MSKSTEAEIERLRGVDPDSARAEFSNIASDNRTRDLLKGMDVAKLVDDKLWEGSALEYQPLLEAKTTASHLVLSSASQWNVGFLLELGVIDDEHSCVDLSAFSSGFIFEKEDYAAKTTLEGVYSLSQLSEIEVKGMRQRTLNLPFFRAHFEVIYKDPLR